MNIEGRIEALERKHKDLHSRVEALEAERAPEKYITNLKKEKLEIKDEIQRLKLELISGFEKGTIRVI